MKPSVKKDLRGPLLTALAVLLVVVGYVVGVVVKESGGVGDGTYNALFNVNQRGEIGFWLYSTQGGCPDLRSKDSRPLVAIVTSQATPSRIEVSSLGTCAEFRMHVRPTPEIVRCAEGFIDIQRAPNSRERGGSYSVTLADGSTRSGEFLAAYCEAESKE